MGDHPIAHRVGHGQIGKPFMPVVRRHFTGTHRRPHWVAIIENFQEVTEFLRREGMDRPVIPHQRIMVIPEVVGFSHVKKR
jgi:hypothetical protein